MATIDMHQLAAFVAVVRNGSFTGAARSLSTHKAHVSRLVSRLEAQLGARLLQRSTRSLAVTEVGRDLYERASGILLAIDETQAAIQDTQREPQGLLRIACGVEFGVLVVNGWIRDYLRRFPNVRVDVDFSNRVVDIIHEGFDVAIRVGPLTDTDLSARKLGHVHYALYASPAYLKSHPPLSEPADLAAVDLIVFAPSPSQKLTLIKGTQRHTVAKPARMVVNNNIAARDAAADGLGIALLPRFQVSQHIEDGSLVEVLPGWGRAPVPVHAVFASGRYLAAKVRAFVDLARDQASDL